MATSAQSTGSSKPVVGKMLLTVSAIVSGTARRLAHDEPKYNACADDISRPPNKAHNDKKACEAPARQIAKHHCDDGLCNRVVFGSCFKRTIANWTCQSLKHHATPLSRSNIHSHRRAPLLRASGALWC